MFVSFQATVGRTHHRLNRWSASATPHTVYVHSTRMAGFEPALPPLAGYTGFEPVVFFRDREVRNPSSLVPPQRWSRWWDSNPHCTAFEAIASCRWATARLYVRTFHASGCTGRAGSMILNGLLYPFHRHA